jgi:hypothetical protein
MPELYGLYLIGSLLCVWFWVNKALHYRLKNERLIALISFVALVILWIFQNYYRHYACKEAVAHAELSQMMYYWESGEIGKKRVIERFEHFEGNSKPWDFNDDEPLTQNGPGLY